MAEVVIKSDDNGIITFNKNSSRFVATSTIDGEQVYKGICYKQAESELDKHIHRVVITKDNSKLVELAMINDDGNGNPIGVDVDAYEHDGKIYVEDSSSSIGELKKAPFPHLLIKREDKEDAVAVQESVERIQKEISNLSSRLKMKNEELKEFFLFTQEKKYHRP